MTGLSHDSVQPYLPVLLGRLVYAVRVRVYTCYMRHLRMNKKSSLQALALAPIPVLKVYRVPQSDLIGSDLIGCRFYFHPSIPHLYPSHRSTPKKTVTRPFSVGANPFLSPPLHILLSLNKSPTFGGNTNALRSFLRQKSTRTRAVLAGWSSWMKWPASGKTWSWYLPVLFPSPPSLERQGGSVVRMGVFVRYFVWMRVKERECVWEGWFEKGL